MISPISSNRWPFRQLCRSLGHRWRERILGPVTTIHLFVLQVLHGNTACAHLPHLSGMAFTDSAYCEARSRLPLAVLQALLRRLVETCKPLTDTTGLWHGHRTWLVDGTGVSMPDTPELQRAFGQPTNQAKGCGFPVARVLALFHAGTGLLQHFLTAPLRSHEMSRVALLHPELRPGDVLVGDRAFGTFAHLALLVGRGIHGVFRMSQRRVVDFTPGAAPATPLEHAEADRPGPVALGPGSGPDRPGRRVVPALCAARMDVSRGVRRATPDTHGARVPVSGHSAGLPRADDHPGDDLARRRGLSRRGAGRSVLPAVGRGDRSGPPEDDARHGRAPLRDGGRAFSRSCRYLPSCTTWCGW